MVIDYIDKRFEHREIPKRVLSILNELTETNFTDAEPGVYTLAGGEKAKVCVYETKTGRRFASHEHYADLTYIVEGEERLTVTPAEGLKITDHNLETDVIHYEGEGTDYPLKKGMFALVVPGDAHRTKQVLNEKCVVKSVIIKLSW